MCGKFLYLKKLTETYRGRDINRLPRRVSTVPIRLIAVNNQRTS
jgi:hypothetical protein